LIHHVKQVVEGRVAAPNVRRIAKFSTHVTKDLIVVLSQNNGPWAVHVMDKTYLMTFKTSGATRLQHLPNRGALMRRENGRHEGLVGMVGAGHPDPSLTRFSDVKTFDSVFPYKAGTCT
jgi:hypothetical protein